jgi:hypothetical protein
MVTLTDLDIVSLNAYLTASRCICERIENIVRMEANNSNGTYIRTKNMEWAKLKNIYEKIENEIIRRLNEIE